MRSADGAALEAGAALEQVALFRVSPGCSVSWRKAHGRRHRQLQARGAPGRRATSWMLPWRPSQAMTLAHNFGSSSRSFEGVCCVVSRVLLLCLLHPRRPLRTCRECGVRWREGMLPARHTAATTRSRIAGSSMGSPKASVSRKRWTSWSGLPATRAVWMSAWDAGVRRRWGWQLAGTRLEDHDAELPQRIGHICSASALRRVSSSTARTHPARRAAGHGHQHPWAL